LEIASRDFETEFQNILQKSQKPVRDKMLQCLKKWSEGEFKSNAQLSLIPSLYNKLKSTYDFPADSPVKVSPQTKI